MYEFYKYPAPAWEDSYLTTRDGIRGRYYSILCNSKKTFNDMEIGEGFIVGYKERTETYSSTSYKIVVGPTTDQFVSRSSYLNWGGSSHTLLPSDYRIYGLEHGSVARIEFEIVKYSETQIEITTFIEGLKYSSGRYTVHSNYRDQFLGLGQTTSNASASYIYFEMYYTENLDGRLSNWSISDAGLVVAEDQPMNAQQLSTGFSTEDPMHVDYRLDVSALSDDAVVLGTIHDHSTRLRRRSLRSSEGSHKVRGLHLDIERPLELVNANHTQYFRHEDTDSYPEGLSKSQLENTTFRVTFDETHEE